MAAGEDEQQVVLSNGAAMPIVGFGTWQIRGDAAYRAVSTALEVGYRHLDTATVYRNEAEVGRTLVQSSLAREELFITTKVPPHANDPLKTLATSLSQLQTDYVDLWLIHWPPDRARSAAMWATMLTAHQDGQARAIGVSNYAIEAIDDLRTSSGAAPSVNQIAWSPFLFDAEQARALRARDVLLEGYSPFQTSRLREALLGRVAAAHEVSAAQVILRWHVQHRVVVIPKSVHRERIIENLDVFGFSLSEEEMTALDALSRER